jgi:anti-sigma regulatory factor (Ser/Thr protein kinase)
MQQFVLVQQGNNVIPAVVNGSGLLDLRPLVSDITPDTIGSGVLAKVNAAVLKPIAREALSNAVVHGNWLDARKLVHIRCRCAPGTGISIIVTDQGRGFDFGKHGSNGLTPDPAAAHGHGIQLMKAYMDDVHFARGGSQVHMRKRSRTTPCS